MRFPWQPKLETRSGSYSDALIALLIREADGGFGRRQQNHGGSGSSRRSNWPGLRSGGSGNAKPNRYGGVDSGRVRDDRAGDDPQRRPMLLPGYIRRAHLATCHKPLRYGAGLCRLCGLTTSRAPGRQRPTTSTMCRRLAFCTSGMRQRRGSRG